MRQHEDLGDVDTNWDRVNGGPDFDEDGPLPLECEDCQEEVQGARYRQHRHAVLCDPCEDARNEAAHERSLEDFYGGSGATTIAEQGDAAAAEKRRQR